MAMTTTPNHVFHRFSQRVVGCHRAGEADSPTTSMRANVLSVHAASGLATSGRRTSPREPLVRMAAAAASKSVRLLASRARWKPAVSAAGGGSATAKSASL